MGWQRKSGVPITYYVNSIHKSVIYFEKIIRYTPKISLPIVTFTLLLETRIRFPTPLYYEDILRFVFLNSRSRRVFTYSHSHYSSLYTRDEMWACVNSGMCECWLKGASDTWTAVPLSSVCKVERIGKWRMQARRSALSGNVRRRLSEHVCARVGMPVAWLGAR